MTALKWFDDLDMGTGARTVNAALFARLLQERMILDPADAGVLDEIRADGVAGVSRCGAATL